MNFLDKNASGWKSCNGWIFWHYLHPETGSWHKIQELQVLGNGDE